MDPAWEAFRLPSTEMGQLQWRARKSEKSVSSLLGGMTRWDRSPPTGCVSAQLDAFLLVCAETWRPQQLSLRMCGQPELRTYQDWTEERAVGAGDQGQALAFNHDRCSGSIMCLCTEPSKGSI